MQAEVRERDREKSEDIMLLALQVSWRKGPQNQRMQVGSKPGKGKQASKETEIRVSPRASGRNAAPQHPDFSAI